MKNCYIFTIRYIASFLPLHIHAVPESRFIFFPRFGIIFQIVFSIRRSYRIHNLAFFISHHKNQYILGRNSKWQIQRLFVLINRYDYISSAVNVLVAAGNYITDTFRITNRVSTSSKGNVGNTRLIQINHREPVYALLCEVSTTPTDFHHRQVIIRVCEPVGYLFSRMLFFKRRFHLRGKNSSLFSNCLFMSLARPSVEIKKKY